MGAFGCSVWKIVRRIWPQFNSNISIRVGNGLKTEFWNETKSPLKISCFTWIVWRKAWLNHEALQKRGWKICYRCPMCEQEAEVNSHLFLHCSATTMFLCRLGIYWVWTGIGNRGRVEDWWKIIPACIWWTLWRVRNARCFEGHKTSIQKIKIRCISLLFFWCKQELVGRQ
ncbi:unnamed protein product [Withania somnifera]